LPDGFSGGYMMGTSRSCFLGKTVHEVSPEKWNQGRGYTL
jgi:hypothetical protein